MSPEDVLASQVRWRSLRVRHTARVVQFFSDGSPESWWHTRYLPSQAIAETQKLVESAFISKNGFSTQVNLSLADAKPKYALFHRRTLTSKVYFAITNFPAVFPIFVVPEPREISRNPTMPLPDWVTMLTHAREGRCWLAVETESGVADMLKAGVGALYLPPAVSIPQGFRAEGRSPSDGYRVLLASESYPHFDLLDTLLLLDDWSKSVDYPSGKPLRLCLALGEGHASTQEIYRDGLVAAAVEMLGQDRVEIWGRLPREEFLKRMARDTDAVIDPAPCSAIAYEAVSIGLPVFCSRGGLICPLDVDRNPHPSLKARRTFWERLRREPEEPRRQGQAPTDRQGTT